MITIELLTMMMAMVTEIPLIIPTPSMPDPSDLWDSFVSTVVDQIVDFFLDPLISAFLSVILFIFELAIYTPHPPLEGCTPGGTSDSCWFFEGQMDSGDEPWPMIYEVTVEESVIVIANTLLVSQIALVFFFAGISPFLGSFQKERLFRRWLLTLFFIYGWVFLVGIALNFSHHLAQLIATGIMDDGGQTFDPDTDSLTDGGGGPAIMFITFIILLFVKPTIILGIIMLYATRNFVLLAFVYAMPILASMWPIDVGFMGPVSGLAQQWMQKFVPLLFLTLPNAVLFRMANLLFGNLGDGAGDFALVLVGQSDLPSAIGLLPAVAIILALPLAALIMPKFIFGIASMGYSIGASVGSSRGQSSGSSGGAEANLPEEADTPNRTESKPESQNIQRQQNPRRGGPDGPDQGGPDAGVAPQEGPRGDGPDGDDTPDPSDRSVRNELKKGAVNNFNKLPGIDTKNSIAGQTYRRGPTAAKIGATSAKSTMSTAKTKGQSAASSVRSGVNSARQRASDRVFSDDKKGWKRRQRVESMKGTVSDTKQKLASKKNNLSNEAGYRKDKAKALGGLAKKQAKKKGGELKNKGKGAMPTGVKAGGRYARQRVKQAMKRRNTKKAYKEDRDNLHSNVKREDTEQVEIENSLGNTAETGEEAMDDFFDNESTKAVSDADDPMELDTETLAGADKSSPAVQEQARQTFNEQLDDGEELERPPELEEIDWKDVQDVDNGEKKAEDLGKEGMAEYEEVKRYTAKVDAASEKVKNNKDVEDVEKKADYLARSLDVEDEGRQDSMDVREKKEEEIKDQVEQRDNAEVRETTYTSPSSDNDDTDDEDDSSRGGDELNVDADDTTDENDGFEDEDEFGGENEDDEEDDESDWEF